MADVVDIEDVLQTLRVELSKRGSDALVALADAFIANDADGSGAVSYAEFEQVLALAGLFLPLPELTLLARHYDVQQNRSINYKVFITALTGSMNERRARMVARVFEALPKNEGGHISLEVIVQHYDPQQHPKVLSGDASPIETRKKLVHCIESLPNPSDISQEDFHLLFSGISAVTPLNDDYFCLTLERCFGVPETDAVEGDSHVDNSYLASVAQVLKEKIRQKTRGQESESHTLLRVFRHFDLDDSGTVDFSQWSRALERFGIIMPQTESAALFRRHDEKNCGRIYYDSFVTSLYG